MCIDGAERLVCQILVRGELLHVFSCDLCVIWTQSSPNLACYAHTRTHTGSRRLNADGHTLERLSMIRLVPPHDSVLVFANVEAVLGILFHRCSCVRWKRTVGYAV